MPKLLRFEPGGLSQYFNEYGWSGQVKELYSSTCSHCQRLTEIPSRRTMMDHVEICRGCMRLICLECVGKPCRPYELEAERNEREHELGRKIQIERWRCY